MVNQFVDVVMFRGQGLVPTAERSQDPGQIVSKVYGLHKDKSMLAFPEIGEWCQKRGRQSSHQPLCIIPFVGRLTEQEPGMGFLAAGTGVDSVLRVFPCSRPGKDHSRPVTQGSGFHLESPLGGTLYNVKHMLSVQGITRICLQ